MKRLLILLLLAPTICVHADENWEQFKYDSRHSGNAADRRITTPLHLLAALPMTDAILTSPVVGDGRIYVLDGSGVLTCVSDRTLEPLWRFETDGGRANCNNVSTPALAGDYLHFGTMAGIYYVLDARTGSVVTRIRCGDPIFSAPVVAADRVAFATLGSRVYCLDPDGTICWEWDFVDEVLGFKGDRWSGEDWLAHRGRSGWKSQFCCSRNLALHDGMVIVPAGGMITWLEDMGDRAVLRGKYLGGPRESPSTLGLSVDASGDVYRQWTRRDNGGRVEILRLRGDAIETDHVRGTETSYKGPGSLAFSSVSIRGNHVYRCRPEQGFGLCRHQPGQADQRFNGYPAVAAPIVLQDSVVYGGLNGSLYVVSLSDPNEIWSYSTPSGRTISAPPAVCNGRVYFGSEDGHLYVLGSRRESSADLTIRDLQLWRIRSRLTGDRSAARHDWCTSFGNFANTNRSDQSVEPPFKIKWLRRYEGTVKHFSVCGGGRMYTHTAEGQIFAVEQETGRLLWRRYFPGVHVSYTSPVYSEQRIYVPQAGLEESYLRCLDVATGEQLWQAPFTGSPSWNRQQPPVVWKNLVIYIFGTGTYTPEGWLFEHQSTFSFPKDHRPLVRAWDKETGRVVWTRDFSEYGSGGDDAGICLMDGRLYYSCYFGSEAPQGITAAMDPQTGESLWVTTKHAVHAGCTISAENGRLYLGGYNPVLGKTNRVWCLDAADGSLVWQSDPVRGAIHVITIGDRYLFTHAQYRESYLIDKASGRIVNEVAKGYRCTRFTLSEPYLLAANLNIHDFSKDCPLIYAGPTIDVLECVGGFVSNGRIFQTTNGGGLQASLICGDEARSSVPPWAKGAD